MVDTTRGIIALACIVAALPFFAAGTVGVLRFPSATTRLHAVSKADTVGVGFVILGAATWWSHDALLLLKILSIWFLQILSSASVSTALIRVLARNTSEEIDE